MVALKTDIVSEQDKLIYEKCSLALIMNYLKEQEAYKSDNVITAPDGKVITMNYAMSFIEELIDVF